MIDTRIVATFKLLILFRFLSSRFANKLTQSKDGIERMKPNMIIKTASFATGKRISISGSMIRIKKTNPIGAATMVANQSFIIYVRYIITRKPFN